MKERIRKIIAAVKRALAWLLAALPLLTGYIAGFVVKISKLAWAAVVEGFERGSTL